METYLLKFSGCLLLLWLLYVLLLEKQSFHHLKRYYLLGAMVVALVIPKLTIKEYVEPVVSDFETLPMAFPTELTETPQGQLQFLDLETVLWLIYGFGVSLFCIRFIVNLAKMYRRISSSKTIVERSFIYVLLKEYRIPHSFFNYIFYNQSKFEKQNIPKEVMLHEETHAKQLHSIDILVMELLQIVFWFHPLIYILKHHIKLNHEFLADQAVLNQGIATKNYQNILLQFSSSTPHYELASAINYSSIKKRFTVMKTQTSKTRIWLSTLVLLPIIAFLFYSFAETKYVEREPTETLQVLQVENEEQNEGASEKLMQEYRNWIDKLKSSSNIIIPVGTHERLAAIYDLMNEQQRNSVELHPFLKEIIPKLYSVEPKTPSKSQFESWKNKDKFALWLDKKSISNTKLNNYSPEDIVYYMGSKVHKNALSEKFPQPFQFSLYTKDGFNKFYKEAFVNDYKALSKTYSKAIKKYINGPQTDNTELKILYNQATKLYNQFTEEELKSYYILMPPPIPAKYDKPRNEINNQQKATPKQVAEYNTWAKKINEVVRKSEANNDKNQYPIIKQKDYDKYYRIYRELMSKEQRENAEAWPHLPPPPPPPPAPEVPKTKKNGGEVPPPPPPPTKAAQYKNGKKKTLNEIIKETPKGVESGFEMLENGESHYFTVYRGEKTYYNKDGYITDKEGKVLPPPPPTPKSAHEFVKNLKNNDITYYFEDKKVSYEEILKITKDNPKISVHSNIQNKKGYVKFWIED